MRFRLFQYSLPASPELEDLNAFLSGQRVAAVSQYLTQGTGGALLVFVVETMGTLPPRPGGQATAKIDYREQLSATEFSVFSRLRDERKKWAEAEGLPVYAVFTNAQLADMVKRRVRTIAELGSVEGVGPARIEKYGARLLALLSELSPESTPPGGSS